MRSLVHKIFGQQSARKEQKGRAITLLTCRLFGKTILGTNFQCRRGSLGKEFCFFRLVLEKQAVGVIYVTVFTELKIKNKEN